MMAVSIASSLRKITLTLLLLTSYCEACNAACLSFTDCAVTVTINSTLQPSSLCTHLSSRDWVCENLQSALNSLLNFTFPTRSSNSSEVVADVCVLIPSGIKHYITAPLFLGGISINFIGVLETDGACNSAGINGTMLPLPSIACNYTVDVDFERIFDLDYSYIDYTLYFNRSAAVLFQNIDMSSCPFPIRMNTVDRVGVHNSLFRDFGEAVFDIYNCHNISVTHSTFHDNRGTGISRYSFRGNTGSIAIGFNGVPMEYSQPQVYISNCNFTRNSATAESLFRSSSGAFFNRAFSGRGGGVGVFFNENYHNISVRIIDSLFQKNYARSFGGAVFLVVFNEGAHHSIDLERTIFDSNIGLLGGGSIQMTFISNGIPGNPHITSFVDCLFRNNSGASGGAIYVYPAFQGGDGNLVVIKRCHFLGNRGLSEEGVEFGTAVAISFTNFFRNKESLPKHSITDCVFEENVGSNGIISIAYAPVTLNGSNVFKRNKGTSSLRIIGALVELYGSLSFIENSVGDVAALHLLSLGQIRLTSGLKMEFIENVGRYGASIISETPDGLQSFKTLAFNPHCFVLYQTPTLPPSSWADVAIKFRQNEAVLGSSLYISQVDTCSWISRSTPFFNFSAIKTWPIWDFGNDSRNTGFDDPYSLMYHVETSASIIDSVNESVTQWPGQKFKFFLTGWDQFEHPTFVSARFFAETPSMQNMVNINPGIVITDSNAETGGKLTNRYTLSYSVSNTEPLYKSHTSLANVRIDVPFSGVRGVKTDTFVIYPLLCPVGYSISDIPTRQGMECRCREDIQEILTCEDDQDTILLQSGYWGAAYDDPNQYNENINNFYPCPAGYCRCSQETSLGPIMCVYTYKNSQPDAQCVCNRQGVLCGECKSGYGVSALLNNCVTCSSAFSLLIVILVILNAIAFVLLTLWDKPFPGLLYPFVFYLQIAPYIGLYFPDSFEIVGKYLVFVGSALNFYFPYDFCLYDNMSPLVAYFLRYIPVLVVMVMSPMLFVIRRKRLRVLDHFGLWWIILFLYTPVVHTSLTILHCPFIETLGEYRWFVDGSVTCFTGWHAPLGLLALLLLLLCFALLPLTVVIALHKYPRRWFYWLRTLSLPLKESYRDKVKWWFAVELGRRLVFLILFVPLPTANITPVLVTCILVAAYGLAQPYKSQWANILETLVLSNFLLLLILQSTEPIRDALFIFPASVTQSNITIEHCSDGYSGIAVLTWFLLPLYYLPLLILLIVGVTVLIHYIRKRFSGQKGSADLTTVERTYSSYIAPRSNVKTTSVRIGRSREGMAATRSHFLLHQKNSQNVQHLEGPTALSPTTSTVFINKNFETSTGISSVQ